MGSWWPEVYEKYTSVFFLRTYMYFTLAGFERKELNHWLQLASQLGNKAPVLVVINKIDLDPQDLKIIQILLISFELVLKILMSILQLILLTKIVL